MDKEIIKDITDSLTIAELKDLALKYTEDRERKNKNAIDYYYKRLEKDKEYRERINKYARDAYQRNKEIIKKRNLERYHKKKIA